MICLFEDHLSGRSLRLIGQTERITAASPAELPAAWEAIEAARRRGAWVALLLNYELGEWLNGTATDHPQPDATPRLTALVHERAQWQPCVSPAHPAPAPVAFKVCAGISRARYERDVQHIRAAIARGDFYQVNYTLPLWLDWPAALDPRDVYARLAAHHPVAHAACIQDGERWILSLSPELFLQRTGDQLMTRPMKGTAPRAHDAAQDRALARQLQDSAKNRAENLMIVDLLRNDLGRVARTGSVQVPALFSLEEYPSVWTLTSTVVAQAPDVPLAAVLAALFPCGSVTGAPKLAAMQSIRRLEARARGIYCGSVGWLAPNGDFSLNVAIRTIEIDHGRAQFGVGGGITHDSDPAQEWHECQWKSRVLNLAADGDGFWSVPEGSEEVPCDGTQKQPTELEATP